MKKYKQEKYGSKKLNGISDGALNQYKFMILVDFYMFLGLKEKEYGISKKDICKIILESNKKWRGFDYGIYKS